MPHITELPIELLIDSLLPCLAWNDLLALGCTSKFFAVVCADDTFWKRKTTAEFNFSGAGSARTSGFRHLYRGLRNPRVFVWGDTGNSRLALSKRKHPRDQPRYEDINYPVELDLGRRVVHLAAGGWSFHALTDDGRVLVWGVLDSQAIGFGGDDLASSGTELNAPLALTLPERIQSLSVGRRHAIMLDAHQCVWILLNWGRPARLVSTVSDVVQVEAGWDVCALLTQSGDAYVFIPFHGSFKSQLEERFSQGEHNAIKRQGDEVPCQCWDAEHIPTRLPALPSDLPTAEAPPKLIKIAAGDKFIVGLTDAGHVLKLNLPTYDELELARIISRGDLRWDYLPKFCEVAHVRNESGFRPQSPSQQASLEDLTVTHISAQFRTFVVYSTIGSSVVLLGNSQTTPESAPTVVPELQNRGVISVVLGDYHYCALTADGEVFSWGKYSNGALGLGSPSPPHHPTPMFGNTAPIPMAIRARRPPPQDAEVPTRVSFHHEDNIRDRYVFAIAAAGWHCGALVIDLHSSSSTKLQEAQLKQDYDNTNMDEHLPARDDAPQQPIAPLPSRAEAERVAGQVPQVTLPIVRGRGMPFRIGYAARGAFAGRGVGRGFADSHSGSGAHPGRAEE